MFVETALGLCRYLSSPALMIELSFEWALGFEHTPARFPKGKHAPRVRILTSPAESWWRRVSRSFADQVPVAVSLTRVTALTR